MPSDLARAIACAEGFGIAGAIPTRAHNPLDLCLGDIGHGTLGEGITIFGSDDEGWAAAEHQIDAIRDGSSEHYTPSMTIQQMAAVYAPGAQSVHWAINVAEWFHRRGRLITVRTPLSEVL